ncbi:hypothetical protein [Pedobacter antarcticus]|uniref:hypothetical protein n=1 Tax=Pedobacter antarcticus TaxID=34086 RepID=UPI001C5764C0|nr:hypothetical protein [Pedobacter antarcticus]
MINYLKESTFTVNEVIGKAWEVTKRNYFSIATLCFLMFITSNASGLMAFLIKDVNIYLSILMAFFFMMMYFTLNLSLLKYIFHLLDDEENDVSIVSTLPTRQQIIRFMVSMLYFMLVIVGVYAIVILAAFPFIYTGIRMEVITNIAVSVGIVAIFITWIRISFFPFFIIDKNQSPFAAIKFSLAITKGNFTKILLLLLVLGGFYVLCLLLIALKLPVIAFFVNILSSFIIVPLSSVALTIAYRWMMSKYDGDEKPDIIHNIV